jgi:hypothetical protein
MGDPGEKWRALDRLLRALGYDPDKVIAMRAKGRTMMGIQVSDRETFNVIRFYTHKQLKKLGGSADFLKAWEAAG